MTPGRVDASLRSGFPEELLRRLARRAALRARLRRIVPGAAVGLSLALLASTRRRSR